MPTADTRELHQQLAARFEERGDGTVELLDSADPAIGVTLSAYGDMQVLVVVSGNQISVTTVLAPASRVADRAGFNEACLRINPINPLSNLGLSQIDGEDVYIVFGELSSRASIRDVEEEIDVLAQNAVDAIEVLAPYFTGA
jgi:uncharacterized protein YjfI (DUF2170 family)